mmetsp:Transcript_59466/g.193954  ORF Transcript_59466/g.193954 Transcript_59466/m.193954 type:complete len:485 (+) Transcript_59466:435-1889(+)
MRGLGRVRRGFGLSSPGARPITTVADLRITTWNVHSVFARWTETILVLENSDIVAFQEADINPDSQTTFREAMHRQGFDYVFFSAPTKLGPTFGSSLAVASRVPAIRTDIASDLDRNGTRHLPLLLKWEGDAPVLFLTVYLPARSTGRAALIDDLLCHSLATGLRCVAVGDWNQTPDMEPILSSRLSGCLRWPDDDLGTGLCGTTRKKHHFDFMLNGQSISVLSRLQETSTSDHDIITYRVAWRRGSDVGFTGPRRAALAVSLSQEAGEVLEAAFRDYVVAGETQKDIEATWRHLSDTAEQALAEGSSEGHSRAILWEPRECRPAHRRSCMAESVRLRRLLRLLRQLQELWHWRPEDSRLRRAASRSAASLSSLFPPLAAWPRWCIECYIPILSGIIDDETQAIKRRNLDYWQSRMQSNLSAVRRWIRKRGERPIERCEAPTAEACVDPRDQLVQGERRWLELWNRDHPVDETPLPCEEADADT